MKLIATSLTTLVIMLASIGCSKAPYGMSIDKHDFYSTPLSPVTLELWDKVNDEKIWQLDIPVNKKAVVQLGHDFQKTMLHASRTNAKVIKWSIFEPGSFSVRLKNKMELSRNPVVLKYVIRDSPEAIATGLPLATLDSPALPIVPPTPAATPVVTPVATTATMTTDENADKIIEKIKDGKLSLPDIDAPTSTIRTPQGPIITTTPENTPTPIATEKKTKTEKKKYLRTSHRR